MQNVLYDFHSGTALRCNLVSIMDNSTDDYKIQSFDLDTQMLLKTALKGKHVTVVLSLSYRNFRIITCCKHLQYFSKSYL